MVTASWVLALMMAAQSTHPYRSTYERTAEAIARAAVATPLFTGAHGAERTAALLVSVGKYESAFDPTAIGDHGQSHCLLQVGQSNFGFLSVTRAEIHQSIEVCIDSGIRMMQASFRACRGRPVEERLAHYAEGGEQCPDPSSAGARASRHRFALANWLLLNRPAPADDQAAMR